MDDIREQAPSWQLSEWWQYVLTLLVLAGIGALVLPAPWRMPASNDEMLHLQSWRNRYGTDDVFPIGRHKIAKAKHIPDAVRELALTIYDAGPIGQRLFIVMQDCHPSLWPITAEIVAGVTNSSLAAIRLLSTLSFLLTLYLLYRIGAHLGSGSEGALLTSLWCISYLPFEYAGMARMYAPAMAALALFLYYYLRIDVTDDRRFRNLALLAILPISLEWFAWPAVYMLMALALVRRIRVSGGARHALRRHLVLLPFFIVCAIFLCYYLILRNFHPSASPEYRVAHGHHPAYEHLATFLAQIGPASFLVSLTEATLYFAIANTAFFSLGAALFLGSRRMSWDFRVTVLLLTIAAFLLPTQIRMLPRHYMLATFVPLVFFGLAVVALIPRIARPVIAVSVLAFGLIVFYSQERFFGKNNPTYDYPQVAQAVAKALQDNDAWIAFPYQRAMCIYRYAALPEPELPTSLAEFHETLKRIPEGESRVVLTGRDTLYVLDDRYRKWFKTGRLVGEFAGGSVIYRITPRKEENGFQMRQEVTPTWERK